MFSPGILGIIINPFYFARLGLYNAIYRLAPQLTGDLLDVGCGVKPYQNLFKVTKYVGLDIDTLETKKRGVADFLYDGNHFPFEDCL